VILLHVTTISLQTKSSGVHIKLIMIQFKLLRTFSPCST